VLLVCTVYSVQYSKIAVFWKASGIGHIYIYNFLPRMTDTITSQNIDLSSWGTLYIKLMVSLSSELNTCMLRPMP
jgi:hypothetical protein